MGKKGGSAPSNQTQTVTNTPYLASYVQDAAKAAKNLYLGNPSTATPTTNTSTTATNAGGMFVAPDGRVYSAEGLRTAFGNERSAGEGAYQAALSGNLSALSAYGVKPMGGTTSDASSSAVSGGTQTTPSGWPEFFPGQTYVDYSPETLNALDMITQRAQNGSALNTSANQTVLDTLNGRYLDSNPYLDNVINTSLNDVTKRYTDQVLPGLASNFAQSGRYGSGIQQQLTTDAVGQLGKEAMGVAGGIRYDNYNNERTKQLQAAALAPTLAQNDYYDAQQLMGVGGARESLNQAKLQDAMDRFNYYETQPTRMLDEYINRINILNGGYGTQTSTGLGGTAQRSSPFAGALSGASAGLGIGSTLAGTSLGSSSLLGGVVGSMGPVTPFLPSLGGPLGIGLGVGGALLGGLFS